ATCLAAGAAAPAPGRAGGVPAAAPVCHAPARRAVPSAPMELTAAEARVLGCLIEQEAAAPDAAPLTLNALRLSCNQTVGRVPVVAYDDRTVEDTLLSLKSRGLARFVPPTPQVPTTRYRHRADERWRMGRGELAVLAVLLLGGVQTQSEIRAKAQRLVPGMTAPEVDAVLDALAARTPRPFAARVGTPGAGRETRWVEVLTGPPPAVDDEDEPAAPATRVPAELASPSYADLVARVADLERRLSTALGAPRGHGWDAGSRPPAAAPTPTPLEARSSLHRAGDVVDDRDAVRHEPLPGLGAGPAVPVDVRALADRVADLERRLARIEAELGALR